MTLMVSDAQLLAALPGDAKTIARKVGYTDVAVRYRMRALHQARAVHVQGYTDSGAKVFALGDLPDAPPESVRARAARRRREREERAASTTQICRRCRCELHKSMFYNTASGVDSVCKDCRIEAWIERQKAKQNDLP